MGYKNISLKIMCWIGRITLLFFFTIVPFAFYGKFMSNKIILPASSAILLPALIILFLLPLFHIIEIPISVETLTPLLTVLIIILLPLAAKKIPHYFGNKQFFQENSLTLLIILLYLIILLPFTHLAGIDTYKWQNVAKSIVIEKKIPWPVSYTHLTLPTIYSV